jgi:transcriptional regulator with XRE-family HTH domain
MQERIYGHHMKWSDYVARLVGTRHQAEVAELSGVSQGTVSRWVNGKAETPNIETAVNFVRSLGGNPVDALLILGVIRSKELDRVIEVNASADDLTNGQLVELVSRRLGVRVQVEGRRGA